MRQPDISATPEGAGVQGQTKQKRATIAWLALYCTCPLCDGAVLHCRQPPIPIFPFTTNSRKERLLQHLSDRPPPPSSNLNPIHRSHRRHFSRGASKEDLIREIERLAKNPLLPHLVSMLLRER